MQESQETRDASGVALFERLRARSVIVAGLAVLASGAGSVGLARASDSEPLGFALSVALAAALCLWLAHGLGRTATPLAEALDVLRRLSEGDIRARADLDRMGAYRSLGVELNEAAETLSSIIERIRSTSDRLQEFPMRLARGLRDIEQGSDSQEEAVEETASLMADINASIKGINVQVESLSQVTEEASSSILQMGSSIDEVARSAGSLHQSVDSSTASIHQISASIRQVAASADSVEAMAEETAAAMTQMDRAIQQVSEHVQEASALTERVSQEAEDGSHAVATTIDGIQTIRSLTRQARDVLEKLAARINEIGEILDVIAGINDETNLLSLNAAIIAAQAGEQGKAFAVVANHVKTLAQRTASSTQEIERLINAVQEESRNAVDAMGSGMEAVEAGVERSRRAGEALHVIRTSARQASSRVAEISRAASEQTRNSTHVAEAAQRTSEMVQQISGAMNEQRRAGDTLLSNSEEALELCRQVHRSTEEQRHSSRFVRENIASISEMIRAFQENTSSHARASDAVSATAARILQVSQKTTESLPGLLEIVEELRGEATGLASDLTPLQNDESQ